MKNLFVFSPRKDAHLHLRTIAKVWKVLTFVFASLFTLISIIVAIANIGAFGTSDEEVVLVLLLSAPGFFLMLFFGWVIEVLLLGFSSIVENNYKELILKNKDGNGNGEAEDNEKPSDSDDDPYQRLQKLAELRKSGIITEEEFEQKKTETLKGL